MKKHFSLLAVIIIVYQLLPAQETLLTIDDHKITKDEFLRIYNKNSSITSEDKKTVDEYLDLFINYKLKVIEAENLGYDTMTSFIKEMAGYTKQLAKPYIENNDRDEEFIEEAYKNSAEEVNVSHILLRLPRDPMPTDTLRVYNRIMAIRDRLMKGESWDDVIRSESPNPDEPIGGDLGWFTVLRMVYPFEKAAFNTPVGEISMPVRTEYGYHLIRVNDRRPNRGEVYAAHILTLIPRKPTELDIEAAKNKIDKAYAELQQGVPWDSVVQKYSEHRATIRRKGILGWINANNAPEELLDACMALDSGQFSQPIKTQYGYHIITPLIKKSGSQFDINDENFRKNVLQNHYITDITKEENLNKIKNEYGFKFYKENMDALYGIVDSSYFARRWNPDVAKDMLKPVFTIGDSTYTQYDVAKYVATTRPNKLKTLSVNVYNNATEYINDRILDYEIAQLPSKYPEYKYLLEEYHDGILLFNLTEDKVWRKAVEDSAGLQKFYNNLAEKYHWEKRVAMTKYSYQDSTLTAKLIKVAKSRVKKGLGTEDISKLVCKNDSDLCVNFVELKYEHGDNAIADSIPWKKGAYLTTRDNNNLVLYFVDAVLPSQIKTLSDARGLYTADYQTYLEKLWIDELRAKYTITVNQEVFDEIKKEEESKTSD